MNTLTSFNPFLSLSLGVPHLNHVCQSCSIKVTSEQIYNLKLTLDLHTQTLKQK